MLPEAAINFRSKDARVSPLARVKEGTGFAGTAPRQFSVMPNKNT
jgi:hypothetical protein